MESGESLVVTVVVPTYNEAGNILALVRRLVEACPWPGLSICIADDNSPDRTADIAEGLGEAKVHVLRRMTDRGYGRAVAAGIRYGLERKSDFIVTMDADFSHQPETIPAMIAEAQRNPQADLVIGSRYTGDKATVEDWSLVRLIMSQFASAYVRLLVGVRIRDTTSGFRCWRGSFVKGLPLEKIQAAGYAYIYETLFYTSQNRGRVREVPNVYMGRTYGESKMTAAIIVEGLRIPFLLRLRHLLGRL